MSKKRVTQKTETAGFYKNHDGKLLYAAKAVHLPDKTSLLAEKSAEYTYPVNGWTHYNSKDEAIAAEKPAAPTERESFEQRKLKRDQAHLEKIEAKDPKFAAKLRASMGQRFTRRP